MGPFNLSELRLIAPELVLGTLVVVLLIGDILIKDLAQKRRVLTLVTLLGLAAALLATRALLREPAAGIFSGQLAVDGVGTFFKLVFLAITAMAVLTSLLSDELPDQNMGEYYALLVSITFGMFIMATGNDLLMIYLGMEMVSIVSYAMAGYRLHDRRSSEAALKYVVYGGAASGLMLFGISLMYGLFGTTELSAINRAIHEWSVHYFANVAITGKTFPLTLLTSFVFVFAGIGYKIACVPFHMWSPDVYEGAPTPFTGFLSVGPKAAGFALLMRVFIGVLVDPGTVGYTMDGRGMMRLSTELPIPAMLGIIAAATMTLGNLAAIPQNNVKRLLAYSSIAHAGYMLMGFVVLSQNALHAVIFYLVVYYLMNLGAFAVAQIVRDKTGGEMLHDYRGLGAREPLVALAMTIFLLSLTGIPPLAGFIGKFYLFSAVIERGGTWYVALAVIGVVNSAISLFYYMKIVKAMYLSTPLTEAPLGIRPAYLGILGALAVPTLVLGLYWTPLSSPIRKSLAFYRSVPVAQISAQAKDEPVPSVAR